MVVRSDIRLLPCYRRAAGGGHVRRRPARIHRRCDGGNTLSCGLSLGAAFGRTPQRRRPRAGAVVRPAAGPAGAAGAAPAGPGECLLRRESGNSRRRRRPAAAGPARTAGRVWPPSSWSTSVDKPCLSCRPVSHVTFKTAGGSKRANSPVTCPLAETFRRSGTLRASGRCGTRQRAARRVARSTASVSAAASPSGPVALRCRVSTTSSRHSGSAIPSSRASCSAV